MIYKKYSMEELRPYLHLHNRSAWSGDGLHLEWSASGFTLRFRGVRAVIGLAESALSHVAYFKLLADGAASIHAVPDGRVRIVAEYPWDGEHTLTLLKLSEPYGVVCIKDIEFYAESPETGNPPSYAFLLPPPPPPARRLLFLGDSLTCGYGVCGVGGGNTHLFETYEEDVTKSFAFRSAAALSADFQILAVSGQGIVNNCNGDKDCEISDFFFYREKGARTPYDFSEWTPHAVILNAGTNDKAGRVTTADFFATASTFLDNIRKIYPGVPVIWLLGMAGAEDWFAPMEALLAEKGGAGAGFFFLRLPHFAGNPDLTAGHNGHPSSYAYTPAVKILTAFLQKQLGWE